jgi:hypothetical protein
MSRTHRIMRFLGITVAIMTVLTSTARAGILQNKAVQVASIATGMPSSTWRLDITSNLPADVWGLWDPAVDPRMARVVPLSTMGYYPWWCTIIVHEAWHIKNQNPEHSSDPNNVLYPFFPSPTFYVYPPCLEDPGVTPAVDEFSRRRSHSRSHHPDKAVLR